MHVIPDLPIIIYIPDRLSNFQDHLNFEPKERVDRNDPALWWDFHLKSRVVFGIPVPFSLSPVLVLLLYWSYR